VGTLLLDLQKKKPSAYVGARKIGFRPLNRAQVHDRNQEGSCSSLLLLSIIIISIIVTIIILFFVEGGLFFFNISVPQEEFFGLGHVLVAANEVHQRVWVVLALGQRVQERLLPLHRRDLRDEPNVS
jgi:hypothetical protein